MQLDWEKLFKRYVMDDDKTPYLTAVGRLTRTQARYELFVYTLFLCVLFGVAGVASISSEMPHKGALGVPIYAFTIVWAALVFGFTKHPWAAAYCGSAPIGVLLYFLLFGFQSDLGAWDKALIIVVTLLWLRYSWRIINIVKLYPRMPEHNQPP